MISHNNFCTGKEIATDWNLVNPRICVRSMWLVKAIWAFMSEIWNITNFAGPTMIQNSPRCPKFGRLSAPSDGTYSRNPIFASHFESRTDPVRTTQWTILTTDSIKGSGDHEIAEGIMKSVAWQWWTACMFVCSLYTKACQLLVSIVVATPIVYTVRLQCTFLKANFFAEALLFCWAKAAVVIEYGDREYFASWESFKQRIILVCSAKN